MVIRTYGARAAAMPAFIALRTPRPSSFRYAREARDLRREPLGDRHRRVLGHVVDDQELEWGVDRGRERPERRRHALSLVPDGHDDGQLGRVVARRDHRVAGGTSVAESERPIGVLGAEPGMTSSSIPESEVVASKPSTSRALRTSGTRCWTSCSNGGSETYRNGRSSPLSFRQIVPGQLQHGRADRRGEVEVLVDRALGTPSPGGSRGPGRRRTCSSGPGPPRPGCGAGPGRAAP
jgi:hypothetical protein